MPCVGQLSAEMTKKCCALLDTGPRPQSSRGGMCISQYTENIWVIEKSFRNLACFPVNVPTQRAAPSSDVQLRCMLDQDSGGGRERRRRRSEFTWRCVNVKSVCCCRVGFHRLQQLLLPFSKDGKRCVSMLQSPPFPHTTATSSAAMATEWQNWWQSLTHAPAQISTHMVSRTNLKIAHIWSTTATTPSSRRSRLSAGACGGHGGLNTRGVCRGNENHE